MDDKKETVLKGRYHLLGTLGRGAMGTVFLAYGSVMERRVAKKVPRLPEGLLTSTSNGRMER